MPEIRAFVVLVSLVVNGFADVREPAKVYSLT